MRNSHIVVVLRINHGVQVVRLRYSIITDNIRKYESNSFFRRFEMIRNLYAKNSLLVIGALLCSPAAFAASGGSGANVESMFQQILDILQGVSVVVVTVAVIWAGYKTLFKGAGLMEVAGPLMGAILIGAAPWLAQILVG